MEALLCGLTVYVFVPGAPSCPESASSGGTDPMVPRSRALGQWQVLLALRLRISANATSALPLAINSKNNDCHWEQCHCQMSELKETSPFLQASSVTRHLQQTEQHGCQELQVTTGLYAFVPGNLGLNINASLPGFLICKTGPIMVTCFLALFWG